MRNDSHDEAEGRYVLDPWYRVEDLSELACDPEYERAHRKLGFRGF